MQFLEPLYYQIKSSLQEYPRITAVSVQTRT